MEVSAGGLPARVVADGLPDDLDLSVEFTRAYDAAENTEDCVFITGKAGTGKSTLLRYFVENTSKKTVVLAPTGVSAINVGGQTIHSFFRFPPRFVHKDAIRRRRDRKLIQKLDTLIIDEVSMVRADLMDGIDWALRVNRDRIDLPFGGAQVVFFGDMFQLSPVVDREMAMIYSMRYDTPYFFSAGVFAGTKMRAVELTKIYRQDDERFIGLLNRIRDNEFGQDDLDMLNSRVGEPCGSVKDPIILTSTNGLAAAINERRLAELAGDTFVYNAVIQDDFDASCYPTESRLKLKPGAQVMMMKNDPEKRWVNGSIGVVRALSGDIVTVEISGQIYNVEPVSWEKIAYSYDKVSDKIAEEVTGVFTQIPMKLAWAITIHKSQGQTFDHVVIDLGRGAFSHGQLYVALSRCTSLEGIYLKRPVRCSDIVFDERIRGISDVALK